MKIDSFELQVALLNARLTEFENLYADFVDTAEKLTAALEFRAAENSVDKLSNEELDLPFYKKIKGA